MHVWRWQRVRKTINEKNQEPADPATLEQRPRPAQLQKPPAVQPQRPHVRLGAGHQARPVQLDAPHRLDQQQEHRTVAGPHDGQRSLHLHRGVEAEEEERHRHPGVLPDVPYKVLRGYLLSHVWCKWIFRYLYLESLFYIKLIDFYI